MKGLPSSAEYVLVTSPAMVTINGFISVAAIGVLLTLLLALAIVLLFPEESVPFVSDLWPVSFLSFTTCLVA